MVTVQKLPRYESAMKPPMRDRRKVVPTKLVTVFAELEREKCISLNTYVMRLFPTATLAIVSSAKNPTK